MYMYKDLFDVMDSLFESVPSGGTSSCKYAVPSFPPSNIVVKEDGSMQFEFALAGYKKEDIEINFDENKIILSTVKDYKAPEKKEKEKELANNIKKPSFKYSYIVPETKFKFDGTTAKFEDGILTVVIPPIEKKVRPTINIK